MDPENVKREIKIEGKSNRYQMSKLINYGNKNGDPKKRKEMTNQSLPEEIFTIEKQLTLLNELSLLSSNNSYKSLIASQIEKKMAGYRSQDVMKKRLDESKFITLNYVIEKLTESQLKCFYCSVELFLLYDIVREMKQWTVDRIDNSLGHNIDNIVISCLECNLKRRKTGQGAFLFTKNLSIVKMNS